MLGWSPGRMAIWWLLVASVGIGPPPLDTRAVASAGLTSSPLDTRGHALRLRNDGFTVLPPSGLTESQVAAEVDTYHPSKGAFEIAPPSLSF